MVEGREDDRDLRLFADKLTSIGTKCVIQGNDSETLSNQDQ